MNRRTLLLLATLALGSAYAYTVKTGDTLYSIARREGVTVEELMRLNGLATPAINVGQELKLPSERATPPKQQELAGVTITAPASVREGGAFTLRLTGERAQQARVRFLSETNEDMRAPAEELTPIGAAGAYAVLGRVVLGQKQPVHYEVRIGDERTEGRIPVTTLPLRVQHLNLPPEISNVRKDPARANEEALVEKAYALRTPQAWTKPFLGMTGVYVVSTQFGQPRRYTKDEDLKYHYGIDYAQKTGTPIPAMNDGTVVIAGKYPVRGGLVVVDHGLGVVSMYFHQSKVLVKPGEKVTRGQTVGLVGNTGLSTGPHLHLEVRVRGEAVNPADLFGKLLP